MGLPSGTLWAPVNVDATSPNGFAETPYKKDNSFFSWGNIDPHNPTGASSFYPWSWGTSNSSEPYVSSPGAAIAYPGTADLQHDAARAICGEPWQLPSHEDFVELIENVDFIDANGQVRTAENKIITMNGVTGIRLRSKINGAILFLPTTGRGHQSGWSDKPIGYYMSKTLSSSSDSFCLRFTSAGVESDATMYRVYGLQVRPVSKVV